MDEIQVLKDVATRLDSAGIPYMLSGSMAMHFYASPRMTRDLDLVVELPAERIPNFVRAFSGAYYLEEQSIAEGVRTLSPFNLIHNTAVVKIDCIPRKNSPYRQLEFSRKISRPVENFEVWVVSPEDLVLSKMEWSLESASTLQENDVKSLLQSQPMLDRDYIHLWAENLGMSELWRKLNRL